MLICDNVYMGTMVPSWGENKNVKTITFSVTDECNLRCTYCYFTHKTDKHKMSFETAKKAVDDILFETNYENYDGVVWEFIGGEPTLEIELIDKISDYILYKMYITDHKWLRCYRFMIGSNGLLYDSPQFQQYILKHKGNLYVAITIDGSKRKHDLSRIKKDGTGSYDDVKRIIPLWKQQFGGNTTKATFSHEDLPYLKESIIALWDMGIKNVSANIVFENVWKDGDVEEYKKQLYSLAEYIIENDLWDKYSVRFFDPNVGTPYTEESMRCNFCGTGSMLAISTGGDYYPCVRFMPSAMNKHSFPKIGDVNSKIDPDKLRAFYVLDVKNQSPTKCINCDIAGGCSWCSGLNYDESSNGTIFERQSFICEMHKANVEVNKYLWRKYELIKHKISPYRYKKITSITPYNKYMYIVCDNKFPSFCDYHISDVENQVEMSENTLKKAIEFCEKNNFVPVFCGCKQLPDDYYGHQIISYKSMKTAIHPNYLSQVLIDMDDAFNDIQLFDNLNVIITFKSTQLSELYKFIDNISLKYHNLNINIASKDEIVNKELYLLQYNDFLKKTLNLIKNCWNKNNYIQINAITSELYANGSRSCGAGKNSYAISPEGEIYYCVGFYHHDPKSSIGNINDNSNVELDRCFDMEKAPLCENCKIKHCKRCVLNNKRTTGEYCVPSEFQCAISYLENWYTNQLLDLLNDGDVKINKKYNSHITPIETFDPLVLIRGRQYPKKGYSDFLQKYIKTKTDEKEFTSQND